MTTTTVTGKLVGPTGAAPVLGQVVIVLVDYNDDPVAGFDAADVQEAVDTVTVNASAADGSWSVALVPNASLTLPSGLAVTAYRVTELTLGASQTYWIAVTASVTPLWVGTLRTTLVGPGVPMPLPGTWCSVTDVVSFAGSAVVQEDVNIAQGMLEALIHRVWRATDATRRDYYWLTRATAWQAAYVNAHPELKTMMDVSSISQDGLSISFKQNSNMSVLYSPIALRFLSSLFRGSNTTIRMNSAFQKNRLTKVGVTAGSSVPWNNL